MEKRIEDEFINTGRRQMTNELQRIEWMLAGSNMESFLTAIESPLYGDLTFLNTARTIIYNVG
jgi:hypothetical protein